MPPAALVSVLKYIWKPTVFPWLRQFHSIVGQSCGPDNKRKSWIGTTSTTRYNEFGVIIRSHFWMVLSAYWMFKPDLYWPRTERTLSCPQRNSGTVCWYGVQKTTDKTTYRLREAWWMLIQPVKIGKGKDEMISFHDPHWTCQRMNVAEMEVCWQAWCTPQQM